MILFRFVLVVTNRVKSSSDTFIFVFLNEEK